MIASVFRLSILFSLAAIPGFANTVIEFDQESGMFLGRGYDTVAGQVKGDCVKRTDPTTPAASNAIRMQFSLTEAESYSSLASTTGMAASASFAGGTFSGNGKASFLRDISVNDYSLYVLAQVHVYNATEVMLDAELTNGAYELMRDNGPEAFYRRCGDTFISGYTTGGELYYVIEIKTKSEREKREKSAELGGSYGAFSASGRFSQAIRKISESNNINIFVYRTGAAAVVQVTPDAMIREAVEFPTKVSKDAYPYKATATPYWNVPLPPGVVPLNVTHAQEVAERLSEYRLQAYQTLANLEYVKANPGEFPAADALSLSEAELAEAEMGVRRNISDIANAARRCTMDITNCAIPSNVKPIHVPLPRRVEPPARIETNIRRRDPSDEIVDTVEDALRVIRPGGIRLFP